jgi:hypothetical protein
LLSKTTTQSEIMTQLQTWSRETINQLRVLAALISALPRNVLEESLQEQLGIPGREVQQALHALQSRACCADRWNDYQHRWRATDDGVRYFARQFELFVPQLDDDRLSPDENRVYTPLRNSRGPLRFDDVWAAAEMPRGRCLKTLDKLVERGLIRRVEVDCWEQIHPEEQEG